MATPAIRPASLLELFFFDEPPVPSQPSRAMSIVDVTLMRRVCAFSAMKDEEISEYDPHVMTPNAPTALARRRLLPTSTVRALIRRVANQQRGRGPRTAVLVVAYESST